MPKLGAANLTHRENQDSPGSASMKTETKFRMTAQSEFRDVDRSATSRKVTRICQACHVPVSGEGKREGKGYNTQARRPNATVPMYWVRGSLIMAQC
jgi:hypothetical protein